MPGGLLVRNLFSRIYSSIDQCAYKIQHSFIYIEAMKYVRSVYNCKASSAFVGIFRFSSNIILIASFINSSEQPKSCASSRCCCANAISLLLTLCWQLRDPETLICTLLLVCMLALCFMRKSKIYKCIKTCFSKTTFCKHLRPIMNSRI